MFKSLVAVILLLFCVASSLLTAGCGSSAATSTAGGGNSQTASATDTPASGFTQEKIKPIDFSGTTSTSLGPVALRKGVYTVTSTVTTTDPYGNGDFSATLMDTKGEYVADMAFLGVGKGIRVLRITEDGNYSIKISADVNNTGLENWTLDISSFEPSSSPQQGPGAIKLNGNGAQAIGLVHLDQGAKKVTATATTNDSSRGGAGMLAFLVGVNDSADYPGMGGGDNGVQIANASYNGLDGGFQPSVTDSQTINVWSSGDYVICVDTQDAWTLVIEPV